MKQLFWLFNNLSKVLGLGVTDSGSKVTFLQRVWLTGVNKCGLLFGLPLQGGETYVYEWVRKKVTPI